MWQYRDPSGDFKHGIVLVEFKDPPTKLYKEVFLHPDAPDGGYRVRLVPFSVADGKCRNPSCGGKVHGKRSTDTKLIRRLHAVELGNDGAGFWNRV